jgi:hypothetical protein
METAKYTFTCKRCGKPFVATKDWARYCSNYCRVRASLLRKKEREKEQDKNTAE